MCVPDFHGCVCVCVFTGEWTGLKSKILDALTRLISFTTHPIILSKNRGTKPKPSQTIRTIHLTSNMTTYDYMTKIFQVYMMHHDSWCYKCLLYRQRIGTFLSLLAPTLHRKNGLPGAGRPFWAAETGRMRLLRQSSSGRRRELPTTQIVTIKPQMKIHWNPMFCCFF